MKTFLWTVLLCSPFSLFAQHLDSIIAQHLNARGGQLLSQIETAQIPFNMSSRTQPDLKTSDCIIYRRQREAFRMDVSTKVLGIPVKSVVTINKPNVWTAFNKWYQQESASPAKAERQIRQLEISGIGDIFGLFYQPESRGVQCALLGSDTLKGVTTWKVEVNIPADTLTIVSWLRQNDGLEVQRVLYEKGEPPMKVFFSDFRTVSGLTLPFRTETHNNAGITVYEYTEIKTNEPLPDSIFDMPDLSASDQKDAAPRKN